MQVKDMLSRGGRRSRASVAGSIFALEHHAWFLVSSVM